VGEDTVAKSFGSVAVLVVVAWWCCGWSSQSVGSTPKFVSLRCWNQNLHNRHQREQEKININIQFINTCMLTSFFAVAVDFLFVVMDGAEAQQNITNQRYRI